MTDEEKIHKEVERLMNELIQEKEKGYGSDADDACILELQNVLTYIDSLQEESVSEDLLDEIHNRWEDDPHTNWPKCPYKDFKNIACHFANWQKQQIMKDAVDAFIYKGGIRLKKWPLPEKCGEHLDSVKVIIIKED